MKHHSLEKMFLKNCNMGKHLFYGVTGKYNKKLDVQYHNK